MPQLMPLYWLLSSVMFIFIVLMFLCVYSFMLDDKMLWSINLIMINEEWCW